MNRRNTARRHRLRRAWREQLQSPLRKSGRSRTGRTGPRQASDAPLNRSPYYLNDQLLIVRLAFDTASLPWT